MRRQHLTCHAIMLRTAEDLQMSQARGVQVHRGSFIEQSQVEQRVSHCGARTVGRVSG